MTEIQVWVLMGLFASLGVVLIRLMLRTLDARFDGLHAEMVARFDGMDRRFDAVDTKFDAVDAKFDAVDARFDAVDAKFDAIDKRIDGLDRDVHMLVERAIDD